MDAIEASAAVVLSDEHQRRLVFVSELLEEIKSLKKRVRVMEDFRAKYFERTAQAARNRRPVEAGSRSLDSVGGTDLDDSVLAESVDADDLITVRTSRSAPEMAYAGSARTDEDAVSI